MKTPLFSEHERLGARIVDFHGWDMPVWYSGIRQEHLAVRRRAGVFDVSHMGEIIVQGKNAPSFLNRMTTRNVAAMGVGTVLYTFLLNEGGGIVDDLMVSRLAGEHRYLLCVNAANREKDYAWLAANNRENATIEDASDSYAMLALQGPQACGIAEACLGFDANGLKPFHVSAWETGDFGMLLISRTGYTGAGGVEIYADPQAAVGLWRRLLDGGATPCGLGARDTLRLEMGYPLHGSDITEDTTPLEAGLDFAVDLNKGDFMGRSALLEQLRQGIGRKLSGVEITDRGVPRSGCRVFKGGRVVGAVTSGSVSPVTGYGMALAYLEPGLCEGETLEVEVRDKMLASRVKKPPFAPATIEEGEPCSRTAHVERAQPQEDIKREGHRWIRSFPKGCSTRKTTSGPGSRTGRPAWASPTTRSTSSGTSSTWSSSLQAPR